MHLLQNCVSDKQGLIDGQGHVEETLAVQISVVTVFFVLFVLLFETHLHRNLFVSILAYSWDICSLYYITITSLT